MKIFALIYLSSVAIPITSFAQSIASQVLATDGQTIVAHGAISYTIGETLVRTFDKSGYTLEEGFQRVTTFPEVAEDTLITDGTTTITSMSDIAFSCYPNPTTDVLRLQMQSDADFNGYGTITDQTGKMVMQFKFENPKLTEIDVAELAAGTYVIALYDQIFTNCFVEQITILK